MAMVATPGSGGSGSGGSGSGARAMAYRDKIVKARGKFWREVGKVGHGPALTDLESKLDELSQSHLTESTLLRPTRTSSYGIIYQPPG